MTLLLGTFRANVKKQYKASMPTLQLNKTHTQHAILHPILSFHLQRCFT